MSDDGGFHHDGEGHGECTGYGCDCDERRYGSHHSGGAGNSGCGIWTVFVIFLIIGAIYKPLGVVLLLGFLVYVIFFV